MRVVERSLDVVLDMPGELEPYEAVAIFPKVTGFVRAIRVDRGSRVRAGDVMAQIEAPELVAQRAEAESRLQAAEAQSGVVRSKADADASTFERLKAASATPGVVAGNDLMIAQKNVEANQGQLAAAQKNVEAARQAVESITQMEGYLRVTAPFDGVVTERNVHPGALVGPNSGTGATTPMLRVVSRNRLRLVVPVPETYIAGVSEGVEMPFTVPAYLARHSMEQSRASRNRSMSKPERWLWSWMFPIPTVVWFQELFVRFAGRSAVPGHRCWYRAAASRAPRVEPSSYASGTPRPIGST